jgi:hypothetical protein
MNKRHPTQTYSAPKLTLANTCQHHSFPHRIPLHSLRTLARETMNTTHNSTLRIISELPFSILCYSQTTILLYSKQPRNDHFKLIIIKPSLPPKHYNCFNNPDQHELQNSYHVPKYWLHTLYIHIQQKNSQLLFQNTAANFSPLLISYLLESQNFCSLLPSIWNSSL